MSDVYLYHVDLKPTITEMVEQARREHPDIVFEVHVNLSQDLVVTFEVVPSAPDGPVQ